MRCTVYMQCTAHYSAGTTIHLSQNQQSWKSANSSVSRNLHSAETSQELFTQNAGNLADFSQTVGYTCYMCGILPGLGVCMFVPEYVESASLLWSAATHCKRPVIYKFSLPGRYMSLRALHS